MSLEYSTTIFTLCTSKSSIFILLFNNMTSHIECILIQHSSPLLHISGFLFCHTFAATRWNVNCWKKNKASFHDGHASPLADCVVYIPERYEGKDTVCDC